MRALRPFLILACLTVLAAHDVPRDIHLPPDGTPSQKIVKLWGDTRPIVLEDVKKPLSDSEALARGAPLVATWTELEKSVAGTASNSDATAVVKLLHDLYGRPDSTAQRRTQIRTELRGSFAQRLQMVDRRLGD